MRSPLALLPLLATAMLVTGCAFSTSKLDIAYSANQAGPLATVAPREVSVGPFADKRPDVARIGYKKNGFGQKTADIVPARPVAEIVRDAIAAELAKNGHRAAAATPPALSISGEVTEFWFDLSIGAFTIEYTGRVGATVNIQDPSGGPALTKRYQGVQVEKRMGGYEGAWTEVMNTALSKMVREISTDPELADALARK
jgi:uncharacterized lipoprotein